MSALLSTAPGVTAGRLVLPAAVDAPAALVIAVDTAPVQETSALVQVRSLSHGSRTVPAAGSAPVRTRTAVQVPPPRGTPV